jgi:hypothetical protein
VNLIVQILARELHVTLRAGEHILPAPDGESFVRALQDLLLAARDRPDAPVVDLVPAIKAATPADKLDLIDHCRVDVATVAEMLRGLDGVAQAAVFVADEPPRLQAFIVTQRPEVTPATVRAALFLVLGDRPNLMCPHVFAVCRSAPDDLSSFVAWRHVDPVDRGSGWPGDPLAPRTAEERCLATAFSRAHMDGEPESVDVGLCYLAAGGRLERIPVFIRLVAELGYRGVSAEDLLGWHSFQALAGKLEPFQESEG